MTSSIRPIFMPERARARRADWAPGPGVLVALPVAKVSVGWPSTNFWKISQHTSGSTDLDVQGGDAELLAAGGDVLGSQHGGVGGGLVTVGLDLHTTGDTANGLAATGITQNVSRSSNHLKVSNIVFKYCVLPGRKYPVSQTLALSRADEPEIGDVDEGVVEGGEDTGNAEDEFTCENGGARQSRSVSRGMQCSQGLKNRLTLADLRSERDVLLRRAHGLSLGRHVEID